MLMLLVGGPDLSLRSKTTEDVPPTTFSDHLPAKSIGHIPLRATGGHPSLPDYLETI